MTKQRTWLDDFQDIVNGNKEPYHLIPNDNDSESEKAYKNLVRNMLEILSKFTKKDEQK